MITFGQHSVTALAGTLLVWAAAAAAVAAPATARSGVRTMAQATSVSTSARPTAVQRARLALNLDAQPQVESRSTRRSPSGVRMPFFDFRKEPRS